jgi:hypothetical protein
LTAPGRSATDGACKYIDRTRGKDGNAFVMSFVLERGF